MTTEARNYPFLLPAFRVEQPLGIFYLCAVPASILLDTCYSHKLSAVRSDNEAGYQVEGAQRSRDKKRIADIGSYINTVEMAFPGTIILSANFYQDSGELVEEESIRWAVEENDENSGVVTLLIPSGDKVASIIDGQHRLFGFEHARRERVDTLLPCAVYLDLPKPYQAYLFATINSTQKPVDKSQTYELIGYNIDKEEPERWSPDKLSVYLVRKLNSDDQSPLKDRILIAAANDIVLSRAQARKEGRWMVSMATVVKGLNALYSSNPKRDSYALVTEGDAAESWDRITLQKYPDKSPLREFYLNANDKLVYTAVLNFFRAVDEVFWSSGEAGTFIYKTVGIQALFDVMGLLAPKGVQEKRVSVSYFKEELGLAGSLDFSDVFFKNASGTGRTVIRNCIELKMGRKDLSDMPESARGDLVSRTFAAW